jgi:hypothetical protein
MSHESHARILQPLKPPVSPADPAPMAPLGLQVWVVLAIVAATGVLSILHYVATTLGNAAYVHDLKVRVNSIRRDQAQRLQALNDAAEAAARESMATAAKLNKKAA